MASISALDLVVRSVNLLVVMALLETVGEFLTVVVGRLVEVGVIVVAFIEADMVFGVVVVLAANGVVFVVVVVLTDLVVFVVVFRGIAGSIAISAHV